MSLMTSPSQSRFSSAGRLIVNKVLRPVGAASASLLDSISQPSVAVPLVASLFGSVLVGADMLTGGLGFFTAAGAGVAGTGFLASAHALIGHHHRAARKVAAGIGFVLLATALGLAAKESVFPTEVRRSPFSQTRPISTLYNREVSKNALSQIDTLEVRENGLTERRPVPVIPPKVVFSPSIY